MYDLKMIFEINGADHTVTVPSYDNTAEEIRAYWNHSFLLEYSHPSFNKLVESANAYFNQNALNYSLSLMDYTDPDDLPRDMYVDGIDDQRILECYEIQSDVTAKIVIGYGDSSIETDYLPIVDLPIALYNMSVKDEEYTDESIGFDINGTLVPAFVRVIREETDSSSNWIADTPGPSSQGGPNMQQEYSDVTTNYPNFYNWILRCEIEKTKFLGYLQSIQNGDYALPDGETLMWVKVVFDDTVTLDHLRDDYNGGSLSGYPVEVYSLLHNEDDDPDVDIDNYLVDGQSVKIEFRGYDPNVVFNEFYENYSGSSALNVWRHLQVTGAKGVVKIKRSDRPMIYQMVNHGEEGNNIHVRDMQLRDDSYYLANDLMEKTMVYDFDNETVSQTNEMMVIE